MYLKDIEQLCLPVFEPSRRESEQEVGFFDTARICSITFTDNKNIDNFVVHRQSLLFKQNYFYSNKIKYEFITHEAENILIKPKAPYTILVRD